MTESRGPQMDRRTLMRTIAVGTGATAVGIGSTAHPNGVVQESEAVVPIAIAGLIGAGLAGAAAAYHTREVVDEYLTGQDMSGVENYTSASALAYETSVRGQDNFASHEQAVTVLANRVADSKNVCWSRGKLAAIEKINAQATEQEVKDGATAAAKEYYDTVITNIVNHWKSLINKLKHARDTLADHANASVSDALALKCDDNFQNGGLPTAWKEETKTFSSGLEITGIPWIQWSYSYVSGEVHIDSWSSSSSETMQLHEVGYKKPDSSGAEFLLQQYSGSKNNLMGDLLSKADQAFVDMESNLSVWAANAYTEVQAGEIDPAELIDATTLASQLSSEEESGYAYAMADLVALGVDTDIGGEMKIGLQESGAQLVGQLATQNEPANGFQVGNIYDPANFSDDFYFSYDPRASSLIVPTSEYTEGLDGGDFYTTREPTKSSWKITTENSETATVAASDFTEVDGSDPREWKVGLSDQLDQAIVNVTEVELVTTDEQDSSAILTVTEPFKVKSYTGPEGSEKESVTYDSYNHQTSDVSLTEEQFNQLLEARGDYDKLNQPPPGGTSGGGNGGGLGAQLKDWAQNRPAEAAGSVLALSGLGYIYTQGGE